jgi:Peptidase family M23
MRRACDTPAPNPGSIATATLEAAMIPPRLLVRIAIAALVGAALRPFPAAGQTPVVASPVAPQAATTAIIVSATNDPLRVAGSDGSDHLEYDLLVTNGFGAPVTLTAIDVLAPDGAPLLHLAGDDLVAATQPLLGTQPTPAIAASAAVAVVMDVRVPSGQPAARLSHRLAYAVAPDAPSRSLLGAFTVDGPVLTVNPRPATVLAPPLRGDGWLAGNGCCAASSIHRAIRIPVNGDVVAKPETFAIDWVRLQDGQLFRGDGSQNDDWHGFGADVLAVADGTVVAAQDGKPEQAPEQQVVGIERPDDYGGNFVTLAIAPGVYAFYAHLQPGSLTVKVGDHVQVGQKIGNLGNTGNSTGPHLHFGLLDAPDPLTSESLPMVFDRWTLAGTIDPSALAAATPTPLRAVGPARPQTATLQLVLDVANFP